MSEEELLYTEAQKMTLAIIPMVSGSLSVLGSSLVIATILLDCKRKLKAVYHRLLLMMSLVDVITSAAMALSTLMVPKGHPFAWNSEGNDATCKAQGFLIGFGMTAFFYNTFLAIYYLLVIRYQVKQEVIAKFVEPLMHFCAFAYTLALISVNHHRAMYVPSLVYSGWCGIAIDSPWGCSKDPEVECEVEGAGILFNVLTVAPIVLGLVVVIASMASIYCAVRVQERSMMQKYGPSSSQKLRRRISYHQGQESMKRTRATFQQCAMYSGAILATMTCFIPSVFSSNAPTADHRTFYLATTIPIKILFPLQGCWNCIVYFRPRYKALSEKLRNESFCTILYAVVLGDTRDDVVRNVSRRRSTPRLSISKLEGIFIKDPDSFDEKDDEEASKMETQDDSQQQQQSQLKRQRWKSGRRAGSVSFEDPLAESSCSGVDAGDMDFQQLKVAEEERTVKTDETSKTPTRLHYGESSSARHSNFGRYAGLRTPHDSKPTRPNFFQQFDLLREEEDFISRIKAPSMR